MKNLAILILMSVFTLNAHAFSLKIGQKVAIEDASQLNTVSTFQNGTYYTVTSARMLKFGIVEVSLEMFLTPQDLKDGVQSGLLRSSAVEAKIYVKQGESLQSVKGLKVLN